MQIAICILLLGVSGMGKANEEADLFVQRMQELTTNIDPTTSQYAYAMVYRRIFFLVQSGNTLNLSDSDINIINSAGIPDGWEHVKPYLLEIQARIGDENATVGLAELLSNAKEEEQLAKRRHYVDVISQLSLDGQQKLAQLYSENLQTIRITRTDYATLASEFPQNTHDFLKNAVENFEAQREHRESAADAQKSPPGQVYGIEEERNGKNHQND